MSTQPALTIASRVSAFGLTHLAIVYSACTHHCHSFARFGLTHLSRWGLFAKRHIVAEAIVIEYKGEYIRNPICDKREREYQTKRIQDYQFRVGPDLVVDATRRGSLARFVNHSCEPNCYAEVRKHP